MKYTINIDCLSLTMIYSKYLNIYYKYYIATLDECLSAWLITYVIHIQFNHIERLQLFVLDIH